MRTFVTLALPAVVLGGCVASTAAVPGSGACVSPLEPRVVTTLFFGRNGPDTTEVVSDSEWQRFVDEVVTPRFPEGLTVLDGAGQWRSAAGAIGRERSKVLVRVHDGTPSADRDIRAIVEDYKRRFRQESVLRVDDPACVGF
ncbi:MAG: DUF3574 domain-containing protein [Candidatus Rokubacteria bacterium]|nr:DUF3574 domain-containing protein [Candidatus Rokubacteria bacterium]